MLFMFRVCHALLSVYCRLGKDWPHGSLVCYFYCVLSLCMWCPGSGVVLDYIDS